MRVALFSVALSVFGETGHDAWLRHRPVTGNAPAIVRLSGDSVVLKTARAELVRGLQGMLGRTLRFDGDGPAIELRVAPDMKPDAYRISRWKIEGGNDRGVLYGVFAMLRRMSLGLPLEDKQEPYAPVRWTNEWNNLDGTIERGYGGRSIFFDGNNVREDLSAARDYARLLASLGINGCAVNNVNANPRVVSKEFLPQLARLAAVFREYGVQMAVSVDFSSPQRVGGLKTFDPLEPDVVSWWKQTTDAVYEAVPDLGGFVLKADSEGRLGPSAHGRSHADAANVIARALKPHRGILFYRGFVYDHHMDWRNLKNDRARAAYDNFIKLDGAFDDNVLIQIKHGPIDFQVREPASPLFGALEKTNQAIELQITQEYFGQGRHNVFLVPMWKTALDFDLQAKGPGTPVKALAAGRVFGRPTGGFVGVSNVGLDANWFGNHLAQANLYGFGRLAWDPSLTSEQIIDEWTRLTFSSDAKVVNTVRQIQLTSWRTFENYTGMLGLQTLTDIVGNHFGVSVEASERNGWGQWHRSDEKGTGMDRTVATGTGYAGQYRPPVARMYESLATCPDELVLFFHHVPYTHVLHSGKTVIQTIYDAHYEGAAAVAGYVRDWEALEGKIDSQRFDEILASLEYHAGAAELWRDAVNSWFAKTSGIADAKSRPAIPRFEAEAMELTGYTSTDVKPWEGASGGKGVTCSASSCAASMKYEGAAGWYRLKVRYFDPAGGASRFRVYLGDQVVDEWTANDRFPTRRVDSSSSTRRISSLIALRPGDVIRVEGIPDGGDMAAFDYLEIVK